MNSSPLNLCRMGCAGLLLLAATSSHANLNDTCLLVLSQASAVLRACVQSDSQTDRCHYQRERLTAQMMECRRQQFTSDAISSAIRSGKDRRD